MEATDLRHLNAMSDTCRIGHAWLTRWAQETKKDNPQPWPSTTVLGRLMDEGQLIKVTGIRPVNTLTPESEATDELVSHMVGETRVSVFAYYGKWEHIEVVARGLGWPDSRLKLQLRIAREIVASGVPAILRRGSLYSASNWNK